MKNLSASLEDYLELICNLIETGQNVKAAEIARKLNISRAAVSEALMKLVEKNLIEYEGHKGITITSSGLKKAMDVISKHNTFTFFFEETLGIDREQAEENACKIEHVISDEVFLRIKSFQQYCSENPEFIQKFKEGYKRNQS
ncbi:MAG: metal-dependent transcriptional regulator [Candidatus Gastranaerophilales bacterium]|nr:metal-dependent transcriptional regulator [Candidatus Gastranaerophilales bacterium]